VELWLERKGDAVARAGAPQQGLCIVPSLGIYLKGTQCTEGVV